MRRHGGDGVRSCDGWFALPLHAQDGAGARWVTAWSTSQQGIGDTAISNTTVRMIARTTIGGDAVRIRIDNTLAREPLVIGRVFVGHRLRGALLAAGSNTPVTFGGKHDLTRPPVAPRSATPYRCACCRSRTWR